MAGGTGNDNYRFGFGDGSDSISDTAGIDRIEFGALVTQDQVTFRNVDGDLLDTLTGRHRPSGRPRRHYNTGKRHAVERFVFADGTTLALATSCGHPRSSVEHRPGSRRPAELPSNIDRAPATTRAMVSDSRLVFRSGDGIDRVESAGWRV